MQLRPFVLTLHELLEPVRDDRHLFNHLDFNAKAKFFQLIKQLLPINEIDRGRTIADCLCLGIAAESARGDDQTTIGTTDHRAAKVANGASGNTTLVALTLEKDWEAKQATKTNDTDAIYTTVTRTTSNTHLNEA